VTIKTLELEISSTDPSLADIVPERGPFKNEGLANLSDPKEHKAFEDALTSVRSRFGEEHPLLIGGEEIWLEDTFASVNPAHPDQVVGVFARADARLAQFAIDTAYKAFETWKRTPAERRAQYLFDAADIIRERKHEFSAWMVYEVGKSWIEADADTAEVIDFLEYYGRQMIRLDRGVYVQNMPGERDEQRYIPLGRRRCHPAVELPDGDHGGHEQRLHRGRQHRRAEAGHPPPQNRVGVLPDHA